jgi:DNA-binding NarL/FixJ family response regulator
VEIHTIRTPACLLARGGVATDDERVSNMTDTTRVLIVDDQQPFRAAARLVVELTDGFEFAGEAETGEHGLRLFGELSPDLILMDIKMPGMDGLETTREILSIDKTARVIVLSTYESGEYEQMALDAGAIAFISKSDFGPEALTGAWASIG